MLIPKRKANLSYYRDSNAKEIDVFAKMNGLIYPLEIKKSASPDRREVKNTRFLIKLLYQGASAA